MTVEPEYTIHFLFSFLLIEATLSNYFLLYLVSFSLNRNSQKVAERIITLYSTGKG